MLRLRHYLLLSLSLLVSIPTVANAQLEISTPPSQSAHSEKRLIRTFVHDEFDMWTSPFRPSNYSSRAMKKYGLPFLAISAGLIATDRRTADWLPNTPGQVRWSGRVSQIGASYTLAGISGGTYLMGRAFGNE